MVEISSEILANNFTKLMEKSYLVYQKLLEKQNNSEIALDPLNLNEVYSTIFANILQTPERFVKYQMEYCDSQLKLISNIYSRFFDNGQELPLYQNNPRDNRFRDEEWDSNAVFNYLKQSYLMTSLWLKELIKEFDDLDSATLKRLEFYVNQLNDAMAPTNFPATNPKVLRETVKTGGDNLIKGLDNLLEDIEKSTGVIKIKSYDDKSFEIGKNIACSEGIVVYQNEIMQLIHYKPLRARNYEIPLLIIPPWINKFYILDLQKGNSFVNWLLLAGYDVYLISWVNPDAKLANKNFENYMLEGPIEAINAIIKDTGKDKVNAIGYCIGGTLLACTLSYLETIKKSYISSATFLTTLIDFDNAGDLSLFLDNTILNQLETYVKEKGFYDGKEMNATFDLLKANDMIWSFYVNNYLLGKDPISFDILYWNSDNTRLPAAMHIFYLSNMYKNNLLTKKNKLVLAGKKIDISKIKSPCYFLSTIDDHIAPWKVTFAGSKYINSEVTFTLAGSGHVAGVINHPSKKKYCYWTGNNKAKYSADEWLKKTKKHQGSWWKNWHDWNKEKSGKLKKARTLQEGNLAKIEDAPGSYVRVR